MSEEESAVIPWHGNLRELGPDLASEVSELLVGAPVGVVGKVFRHFFTANDRKVASQVLAWNLEQVWANQTSVKDLREVVDRLSKTVDGYGPALDGLVERLARLEEASHLERLSREEVVEIVNEMLEHVASSRSPGAKQAYVEAAAAQFDTSVDAALRGHWLRVMDGLEDLHLALLQELARVEHVGARPNRALVPFAIVAAGWPSYKREAPARALSGPAFDRNSSHVGAFAPLQVPWSLVKAKLLELSEEALVEDRQVDVVLVDPKELEVGGEIARIRNRDDWDGQPGRVSASGYVLSDSGRLLAQFLRLGDDETAR